MQMLREDIVNGIIPLDGRSDRNPSFIVEVNGDARDIKEAKFLMDSFLGGGSRDFTQSFCRALEKIARHLVWDAISTYELVKEESGVSAHHVSPQCMLRLPFYTLQLVPSKEREKWSARYLYCPNRRIWRCTFPDSLGGSSGYKRMIRRLSKTPPGSLPEFAVQEVSEGRGGSGFDFNSYMTKHIVYINKVTAQWNWHRRDWSDDRQCEYWRTYKRAMFKRSQILLREHLTKEVNCLFKMCGIKCMVAVRGLSGVSDVAESLEKLNSGEIDFRQVYDRIFN
ncbi:hypothetical protein [Pseudomonas multiresinivorans]|uniref:Uncharacterized protein n=1 Tax=Pseudomonas multiresinivorans TaxID=95301 RepID=A0A7Z3BLZ0_9PSED|nr:hypothetical protein [Pseudomonas multiresinivorans]QJP09353.1 hypothetical protein G4G71_16215 [Pseudomonas multiresinivorans]